MAPWAGRVRHGRFGLFGADQQLELNFQDGDAADPDRLHAIHGTVFTRPWIVETLTDDHLTARCTLDDDPSMKARTGWRFGGTARQTIELMDGQLRCDLSIEVDHDTLMPFPARVGWHPWFRKPDRLSFHPDAMYERDDIGLPTGRLVAPSDGPWDDCFVNTAPVTLHYDRDTVHDISAITLSSDCDHWVVYDQPDDATCVEPQSGPPDAFNIRPQPGHGNAPAATHDDHHLVIERRPAQPGRSHGRPIPRSPVGNRCSDSLG